MPTRLAVAGIECDVHCFFRRFGTACPPLRRPKSGGAAAPYFPAIPRSRASGELARLPRLAVAARRRNPRRCGSSHCCPSLTSLRRERGTRLADFFFAGKKNKHNIPARWAPLAYKISANSTTSNLNCTFQCTTLSSKLQWKKN